MNGKGQKMNDRSVELSLRTWYKSDDPLYSDPLHPAIGLAGELGELYNLHKKKMFKPGFEYTREMELDEWGDYWYYLRILCWQKNFLPWAHNFPSRLLRKEIKSDIISILHKLSGHSNSIIWHIIESKKSDQLDITKSYHIMKIRLDQLDCTIDRLTNLNWQKLKPGSKRGDEWMKRMEFNWSEFEEE